MHYLYEDLQRRFGPDRMAGARRCLEQGWVALPDIRQDGRLITSLIESPGHRPLRVYIRIQPGEGEAPQIRGECSCGSRTGCEHVVAVLLRALVEAGDDAPAAPAGGAPMAAAVSEQGYPADVSQRLLYLLEAGKGLSRGIGVTTVSARLLPGGGFDRLLAYRPEWATRGRPPRFLRAQDLRLLAELKGLQGPGQKPKRQLLGAQGADLLQRILATGRCYLGQAKTLLEPGNERPARFQWEWDEQGRQRPLFSAGPPAVRLFLLDRLWYLDPGEGCCGPLRSDLPEPLLQALPELARGVEADQVETQQARLAALDPDHRLPPLQPVELEQLSPGAPTPCLRFSSRLEQAPWGEDQFDSVELSFDYGGRRYLGGEVQWFEQGRLIRLQRHPDDEAAAARRLLAAGLEPAEPWGEASAGDYFPDGPDEVWFDLQADLLPQLRREGWHIEFDPSFRWRLLQAQAWFGQLEQADENDWFQLRLGVQLDGERINLLPPLVDLLREFPNDFRPERLDSLDPRQQLLVPLEGRGMLSLPIQRLRGILETLFELYQQGALDEAGGLPLSRIQLARLVELSEGEAALPIEGGEGVLAELIEGLRGVDRLPSVEPPEGLQAQLRDYQQEGLAWLQFLRQRRLAGVLADDMGLGKTLQTLAHLLLEKQQGRLDRPCLLVAPTSLMTNWRREARRFTPDLRLLLLHGPKRRARFREIPGHDLVLTSYPLLARDRERLQAHAYHLLILDEAQAIKNPKTQASRSVRELRARQRLCLTGTPLENHLGELWSLFDFLLPGLLGSERQFRQSLRNPIEKRGDERAAERLARRLRPFMLRRTKQQVVRELPPKTEILRSVALEGKQRELYESIRLSMHRQVREVVQEKGWARSRITVLDALLKLRQVCCDPRLLKLEQARAVQQSAKLELLMELLPELVEEGRRILLFSQFTGMLGLIEEAVIRAGIEFVKLTGRTRDRARPVDRFQDGQVPLFLISLKAGGTGLNLTAADTVIHYDPWWNPAVERQATDRAHRIGQENPVFVYKLIGEGTVEEKIQAMQAHKQTLADSLFERRESGPGWSDAELEQLFEPLA